MAGIDFEASYFGNDNVRFTNSAGRNIVGREVWRLENAYEHFADSPLTGTVLPLAQLAMPLENGQVFIMDIHFGDGIVERQFYRVSGYIWQNMPSAQGFTPRYN